MATLSAAQHVTRRDFLRAGLVMGAGAAGLAAGYAAVPDVLAKAVYAGKKDGVQNDRVLVMVQLAGGNDGLQTVIPLQDSRFRDLRPQLSAAVKEALPLTQDFGFNKSMPGLAALYQQGKVAIVQNVGYPDPSGSHFDSIRVWETADPTRRVQDGWLGKAIEKNYDSAGHPLVGCACGSTGLPGTLRDLQTTLTVVNSKQTFRFQGGEEMEQAVGALYRSTPGIYGALFDSAMATARDTVAQLKTAASKYQAKAQYSDRVPLVYSTRNQLASALQLAAELIVAGTGAKIIHVTLGGFDTHFVEATRHADLMGFVDGAISTFQADLAANGMADRVLVATWSEFGRRARENASAGTDHGAAAPILLIGDNVAGGMYGGAPDLGNLDSQGNLRYTVDFRSVYQEILERHLGVDAREVLEEKYERIAFVKNAAETRARTPLRS